MLSMKLCTPPPKKKTVNSRAIKNLQFSEMSKLNILEKNEFSNPTECILLVLVLAYCDF